MWCNYADKTCVKYLYLEKVSLDIFKVLHKSMARKCIITEASREHETFLWEYSDLWSRPPVNVGCSVRCKTQGGRVSVKWHQPVEESVLHDARVLALHSEDNRRDGYSEVQAEPSEWFSGQKHGLLKFYAKLWLYMDKNIQNLTYSVCMFLNCMRRWLKKKTYELVIIPGNHACTWRKSRWRRMPETTLLKHWPGVV